MRYLTTAGGRGGRLLLLAAAALSLALPGRAATGVTLARDGKALLPIVVPPQAIPAEKTAAEQLATYLGKISGATFTVLEGGPLKPGAPAIYVGATGFEVAQGIDPSKLAPEESVVRTVGGSLIITGGRPRGTLYGVCDLLENVLGVRWYTPWVEKVPTRPTLILPALDRRSQPYMRFRSHYTHLFMDNGGPTTPDPRWKWFNVHNRINEVTTSGPLDESVGGGVAYGPRIQGGHGFAPYLPADKYFADHPEYFSMRAGKRVPSNGLDGNHACLSNPDVLRLITEGVREDMRANPQAYCFTVAVNDGGSSTICDCEPCRAIARKYGATEERYTDAGLVIWFVNQVADAIKDEFPDKFIRTLAYGPASQPPVGIEARDNVIVQICAGPRSEAVYLPRGAQSYELKPVAGWTPFCKHIWLWDYALPCYTTPGFIRPLIWKMDQQMKYFKSLGRVEGMFQENELLSAEDTMFAQFYEMNMWIFTRLCQDPSQDVEALATDFMDGFYGPAGKPLRQYLALTKARLPLFPYRFWDYATMRQAQGLFDQALAAVKSKPEYLDRVKASRMQLDLAALAWRSQIIADYLRQGGKAENYPFRIAVLKARLLTSLDTNPDPLINSITSRYWVKGHPGREPIKEIIRTYIGEVSAGVEYTPLPAELRGLPPARVIDLAAPAMATGYAPLLVADPEATLGLAMPRTESGELPMNISYWSGVPGRSNEGGVTINAADVKGPGYHLYTGPTFPLNEWTFLYMTASWGVQRHLYSLYDPAHPDRKWTAYASLKFTGPALPYGKPEDKPGLFIDRVILVQEPDAAPATTATTGGGPR
ncbi:MAG TPA: DUF4838 domain-containing protein [Armatimonadota bacterium]|jgi:hypothetical protein